MAANGKVTRKDLVEEKVFNVGRDFANSLQPGIESTIEWKNAIDQLKQSALEYANIEKEFKVSEGRKEFLKIKQEEEKLRKSAAAALKAEQDALIAIQRVKQSNIDTEKKTIALQTQKEKSQKKTLKLTAEERLEIRLLNRGKREAAIISSKLSTEYEKQAVRLTQLRRRYKDVALTQGESSNQAQRLAAQINKIDTALKRVDANVGQFQRNVGNYGAAMRSAAGAVRSLASAIGLTSAAFLTVQVVRDAIKVIRDFEKQNATLSAILQVERGQMQGLTTDAVRLGETTVKTASQVTELQIAYARLGFSQQQILDLTEPTINGSIALNAELDRTAGLVGAVINTFDDFDTTDAATIIDQLSLATAKSALNFDKLEKGIPIVAGAANAARIPFTKLVALLGKLSDSGIDVSTSSTALRNIFIESAAQGLDYSEILQKIKDSQDTLTASNDEFGKRAAVSAAVLSKNIETTEELDVALQGAAGTAESMANKELDTLDGSMKLLRSAFEGFILNLNESSNAGNELKEIIAFLARNFSEIVSAIAFGIKAYIGYIAITKLASIQTALMNKQMVLSRTVAIASARGINIAALAWIKFTRILRANALGLAVTAIAGLIFILNKYNKTLEESIKSTNESTESFLENRKSQEKVSESLQSMAARYDELSSKTELNKEEQKELDDIVAKIAKTIPKAVTEIDKYGNALKLNTAEVDKFNQANNRITSQRERALLRENTEQLERLKRQQEGLNKITEEGQTIIVKGIGRVANYNGVLKTQIALGNQAGVQVLEGNELTAAQIEIVQKAIAENEKAIEQKEQLIESLTAEGRANILARQEAEAKAEADAKAAEEARILSDQKTDELLKVSDLKEKISELKKEQDGLTKSDKERASQIVKLIKAYQDEINAILGVSSANKTAEKNAKEREKREKKLAADAFALRKFSLDSEIDTQKKLASNEKASFDEREAAIAERARLELELAEETAKRKLELTEQLSGDETALILSRGLAANEAQKEITDEQLLILKEFEEKKKQIQGNEESGQDGLEIDRIKQQSAIAKAETEKRINAEIEAENQAFLAKEGIYANEERAVEERERRIAEIKRRYALEGLNAQVVALEQLIEKSEEGSKERIEAEAKVAKAKADISQLGVDAFIESKDGEVEYEKLTADAILSISSELATALADLGNAIFEGRIQKIDDEIEANDAKFEALLENENLTVKQREELEKKQEKQREELEKKKRKEQRKQAILDKALAITQIGISTAQAIMQAYAQLGPVAGTIAAVLVGVLGTIQTAAVIAKPIPSYFLGTDNHPGGPALVGEVRPEVIQEPNKKPYVVDKPSILDLPKGTKVTPSVEEYQSIFRASIMASLDMEDKKISAHEARMSFNTYQNFETRKMEWKLEEIRKELKRKNSKAPIFKGNIVIEQPYTKYN